MFKVEIENQKGEKKVQNCNDEREIYSALRELGNDSLLQRLKIGEDKNGVNLKLLSDNDFDAAIAKILTDNGDTLYDAVLVAKQLNDLKDDAIKEEIERNAINEQYDTKEELYDDIRKTKIEFSSIREDFYEAGKEFKELLIGNYDLYERERNRPKQLNFFSRYEELYYEEILRRCILSCKIKK